MLDQTGCPKSDKPDYHALIPAVAAPLSFADRLRDHRPHRPAEVPAAVDRPLSIELYYLGAAPIIASVGITKGINATIARMAIPRRIFRQGLTVGLRQSPRDAIDHAPEPARDVLAAAVGTSGWGKT